MSAQRPYYHVAPVLKVPTVFASIEYPRDEPPESIEIDGTVWKRVDDGDESD
jgi:hypothetical protein